MSTKAERTVTKWGNNPGVRIPADIAAAVPLTVDQRVQVSARGDAIVIAPARRQRCRLDELLSGITPRSKHEAADYGPPVARELL